jgi:hypothetical protein
VLYVRVNASHGASTAWRSTIRLTSTSGRVDFPTVAASGSDAYVAFTDSNNGNVRLAATHDRGATWTTSTIGTTSRTGSQGRAGLPSVAASGSNIVVAWQSDGSGTVKVRRSGDHGGQWGTTETLTGDAQGAVTAAARGTRAAVSWTTGSEIHVRVAEGATWGADLPVAGLAADAEFAYSPSVVLQGRNRVGIAWSELLAGDDGWARLKWVESVDDGAKWFQTETIATTDVAARRTNDWPSVVWPSGATRLILWNGFAASPLSYRLYLRIGAGAPAGPQLPVGAPGTSEVDGPATPPLPPDDAPTRGPVRGHDRQ